MKQRFHKWHFKELLITGIIIAASKCCWGIKLDDWLGAVFGRQCECSEC